MKLNNKGFAISTIMYMILIMAVILITLTLSLLSGRKFILSKIKDETKHNIYSICKGVTEDTKTTGNVPKGEYEPGDEYICEVGPNKKYRFFVLSKDDDNVNLIMDSNITASGEAIKSDDVIEGYSPLEYNQWHSAWINQVDYELAGGQSYNSHIDNNIYGPITALKYVESATSSWSNIPMLNETYTDEGGNYRPIRLTGKARLPKKSEINNLFVDKTYNMDNYRTDKLPIWATNYLYNIENETTIEIGAYVKGRTHINRLGNYWLLSSVSINIQPETSAYDVGYDGGWYGYSNVTVDDDTYKCSDDNLCLRKGIRPVISIPFNKMD